MKVWLIYLKKDLDINVKKPELYAITTRKELLKLFSSQRNIKRFHIKENKISKKEYKELIETNSNRGKVLSEYPFMTLEIKNGMITASPLTVVTTYDEYIDCSNDSDQNLEVFSQEFWDIDIPIKKFNSKLKESLEFLDYVFFYKLYKENYDFDFPSEYNDYSGPNGLIDEFKILLYKYGALFNL